MHLIISKFISNICSYTYEEGQQGWSWINRLLFSDAPELFSWQNHQFNALILGCSSLCIPSTLLPRIPHYFLISLLKGGTLHVASNSLCSLMKYPQKQLGKHRGQNLPQHLGRLGLCHCMSLLCSHVCLPSRQWRDRMSRSSKVLPAAAESQMMLYTWGNVILILFLKKLRLPETISTRCKMLIWFSISLLWVNYGHSYSHPCLTALCHLESHSNKKAGFTESVLNMSRGKCRRVASTMWKLFPTVDFILAA